MTTPAQGVKMASDIAENQYMISILFILLLALCIWGTKVTLERMRADKQLMELKNDAVIEKVEKLHQERQKQLLQMADDNKRDSSAREVQLMTHNNTLLIQLQSQTSSLEEITRTQATMQKTQQDMQKTQQSMNESLGNLQESFEEMRIRMNRIEDNKTKN